LYEGKYLYGKKNGKGKEYYDNGKLKYEELILMEKELEKEKNIIFMEN